MAAAVYGTTEFMVGLATNAHDDSANDSVTCMLTSCGQVADNVLIKVRRRTYALSRSTYNSGKDSSRLRGMIKRKREWHSAVQRIPPPNLGLCRKFLTVTQSPVKTQA